MQFRAIGYEAVADDPPDSMEVLGNYAKAGRSWVALSEEGDVVGYILLDVIDGAAHIDQVTVHPAHQGTGQGVRSRGSGRHAPGSEELTSSAGAWPPLPSRHDGSR